jgi:hypothetical protein
MPASQNDQSYAEATVGIAAVLTGLGAVTFALFPLAIPFVVLLGLAAAPLLLLPVVVGIPVALGVGAWKATRAMVRGVRGRRPPSRPARTEGAAAGMTAGVRHPTH